MNTGTARIIIIVALLVTGGLVLANLESRGSPVGLLSVVALVW